MTGGQVAKAMARVFLILALILSPALFVAGAAVAPCAADAMVQATTPCHGAALAACCCEAAPAPESRQCPCVQAPQRSETPVGPPPAAPATASLPHLALVAIRNIEFTLPRQAAMRLDRFPASPTGAARTRAVLCVWLT